MGGFFKIHNMKYQVIAGICPGIKKIHEYGEIITGDMVDNAEQRVKDRWLKVVEDGDVKQESVAEVVKVVTAETTKETPVVKATEPATQLSDKLKKSRD
jgi:hypothetical protein